VPLAPLPRRFVDGHTEHDPDVVVVVRSTFDAYDICQRRLPDDATPSIVV
jgi:hypothetical protein